MTQHQYEIGTLEVVHRNNLTKVNKHSISILYDSYGYGVIDLGTIGISKKRGRLNNYNNRWLTISLSIGLPLSKNIDKSGPFTENMRFSFYQRQILKGFYLSLGEMQVEYTPTSDTYSFHIDPFSLQFRRKFYISDKIRLFTDIEAAFSLWQKTNTNNSFANEVKSPLLACSSASQLKAVAGIVFAGIYTLEMGVRIQGDPWHYIDGENCAGNSPLWQSHREFTADFKMKISDNIDLFAGYNKRLDSLFVDTSEDHDLNPHSHKGTAAHESSTVGRYSVSNISFNTGLTFRF